jgi:hypothetical protein
LRAGLLRSSPQRPHFVLLPWPHSQQVLAVVVAPYQNPHEPVFAKTIQINLEVTEVAELQESFVKIRSATKIRTLFFYPSIVRYSPEDETGS